MTNDDGWRLFPVGADHYEEVGCEGIGSTRVLLQLTRPERISDRLRLCFVRVVVVDDERSLVLGVIRIARIGYGALVRKLSCRFCRNAIYACAITNRDLNARKAGVGSAGSIR